MIWPSHFLDASYVPEEKKESLCIVIAACTETICKEGKGNNKRKRKRMWTKDIFLNREIKGANSMLMQEIRLKDLVVPRGIKRFMRKFCYILFIKVSNDSNKEN